MVYKMDREDRAKQFMPFAALKGYPEALRRKEKEAVPGHELAEEYYEELNRKLQQIQKNDRVTAVYFNTNEYRTITGMVDAIEESCIQIARTKISFKDLYEIYAREE